MQSRPATPDDAESIGRIYNQGIEDRATFESRPRSVEDIRRWFDGTHPIVVVEDDGQVIAYAATSAYRPNRECYAGVAEFSVYAARHLSRSSSADQHGDLHGRGLDLQPGLHGMNYRRPTVCQQTGAFGHSATSPACREMLYVNSLFARPVL
jgi:hypothetical protein